MVNGKGLFYLLQQKIKTSFCDQVAKNLDRGGKKNESAIIGKKYILVLVFRFVVSFPIMYVGEGQIASNAIGKKYIVVLVYRFIVCLPINSGGEGRIAFGAIGKKLFFFPLFHIIDKRFTQNEKREEDKR